MRAWDAWGAAYAGCGVWGETRCAAGTAVWLIGCSELLRCNGHLLVERDEVGEAQHGDLHMQGAGQARPGQS